MSILMHFFVRLSPIHRHTNLINKNKIKTITRYVKSVASFSKSEIT